MAFIMFKCFYYNKNSPGIHVADRLSGQRLASLPHVLQTMGRPFGLIAIPNECRRGKQMSGNQCLEKNGLVKE